MLEHPHDLFIPLLNEFNRLYQIVRDHKRRLNFTVEETAEDLLVCVHMYSFLLSLSSFNQLSHLCVGALQVNLLIWTSYFVPCGECFLFGSVFYLMFYCVNCFSLLFSSFYSLSLSLFLFVLSFLSLFSLSSLF